MFNLAFARIFIYLEAKIAESTKKKFLFTCFTSNFRKRERERKKYTICLVFFSIFELNTKKNILKQNKNANNFS